MKSRSILGKNKSNIVIKGGKELLVLKLQAQGTTQSQICQRYQISDVVHSTVQHISQLILRAAVSPEALQE